MAILFPLPAGENGRSGSWRDWGTVVKSGMMTRVSDLHVVANTPLPSPRELMAEIPRSEQHAAFVARAREEVAQILSGGDDRFLLIVGPCSIHDLKAGRAYARTGTLNVGTPGSTGINSIEYSGATDPVITVDANGTLNVTGQIRRPTTTTQGNLRYEQFGGAATIYGNGSSGSTRGISRSSR